MENDATVKLVLDYILCCERAVQMDTLGVVSTNHPVSHIMDKLKNESLSLESDRDTLNVIIEAWNIACGLKIESARSVNTRVLIGEKLLRVYYNRAKKNTDFETVPGTSISSITDDLIRVFFTVGADKLKIVDDLCGGKLTAEVNKSVLENIVVYFEASSFEDLPPTLRLLIVDMAESAMVMTKCITHDGGGCASTRRFLTNKRVVRIFEGLANGTHVENKHTRLFDMVEMNMRTVKEF